MHKRHILSAKYESVPVVTANINAFFHGVATSESFARCVCLSLCFASIVGRAGFLFVT